jgi:asparagine synthase (glutamine-hydrolysing)
MSGIAGIVDLAERRPVPEGALEAMALALLHRGPDDGGFLEQPGLGLAWRRLRTAGPAAGPEPGGNEDRSVFAVCDGELFDAPQVRAELEGRGHRLEGPADEAVIPHLWEDRHEAMFERLRGQFAFALWDGGRRRLLLARDRFGVCPLFWTRQGDWLLFASEIKALLASGLVEARPDLRGINHAFTFYGLPGPVTCFEGVSALLPGRYLDVRSGTPAAVREGTYWEMEFPDRGDEDRGEDPARLVDGLEAVLLRSVERRLRADVPVVSYLSGGLDSSLLLALSCRVRGRPNPTFTYRVEYPHRGETGGAALVAGHFGVRPAIVGCGPGDLIGAYPRLVRAAEGPVIDTSAAAVFLLARGVHEAGYRVALTGEGSDEWLAGYPWFRANKLLGFVDSVPGLPLGRLARLAYLWLTGTPQFPGSAVRRTYRAVGGLNAWLDVHGLLSLNKLRFFAEPLRRLMADHSPYEELQLDPDRLRRWHPLHRAAYLGGRIHLPGLHLLGRGDRAALNSSVQLRYPFLDEEVFGFLAPLHPRWKLRGLEDKYLLRRVAERWLPPEIVRGRKALLHAPLENFHSGAAPAFVDQLLSEESLHRAGYFEPWAVAHWRQAVREMRAGSLQRLSIEMGLVGVIATQLWHQAYLDAGLADLPGLEHRAAAAVS